MHVTCALHFDAGLVVLGPKCCTIVCLEPAVTRAHWPSGALLACERCAASWRRIAEAMGTALHVEPVWYQPCGLDVAAQGSRRWS